MFSVSESFQACFPAGLNAMPFFVLYDLRTVHLTQSPIPYHAHFWKTTPSCLFAIEFPRPLLYFAHCLYGIASPSMRVFPHDFCFRQTDIRISPCIQTVGHPSAFFRIFFRYVMANSPFFHINSHSFRSGTNSNEKLIFHTSIMYPKFLCKYYLSLCAFTDLLLGNIFT